MHSPRVLFVSKPVVPPWNDGSKNLVRDVATHLRRSRPTVLASNGHSDLGSDLGPHVATESIYPDAGSFSPSLASNARVAARLFSGDPHDVWHFVSAPTPLSAAVAHIARRAWRLRGWRGAIVQTIASAPRSFDPRWIFGDAVVVLSEYTRGRLLAAGFDSVRRRLEVIPPCARAPRTLAHADRRRLREQYELGDGPIITYPGDYEISTGAQTFARAIPTIASSVDRATFVFACRKKTPRAGDAQAHVERIIAARGLSARTRHLGEVVDMGELLGISDVVVFPVDDLYGKVDIPLVLLEAMALEIPIVVASRGPLEALAFAPAVAPSDSDGLARSVVGLLADSALARRTGADGRHQYEAHYTPAVVAAAYDDLYAGLAVESAAPRKTL